jgi:hypothetical protein
MLFLPSVVSCHHDQMRASLCAMCAHDAESTWAHLQFPVALALAAVPKSAGDLSVNYKHASENDFINIIANHAKPPAHWRCIASAAHAHLAMCHLLLPYWHSSPV